MNSAQSELRSTQSQLPNLSSNAHAIWGILHVHGGLVPKSVLLKALDITEEAFNNVLTELKDFIDKYTPLSVQEVENELKIVSKHEYKEYIKKALKINPIKLPPGCMEALAIIAYKQPISKKEIDELRGVDSSNSLRLLLNVGYIAKHPDKGKTGNPFLYKTTKLFLEKMGLTSLAALPQIDLPDESLDV